MTYLVQDRVDPPVRLPKPVRDLVHSGRHLPQKLVLPIQLAIDFYTHIPDSCHCVAEFLYVLYFVFLKIKKPKQTP